MTLTCTLMNPSSGLLPVNAAAIAEAAAAASLASLLFCPATTAAAAGVASLFVPTVLAKPGSMTPAQTQGSRSEKHKYDRI